MVQVRLRVSFIMLTGLCASLSAGEFGHRGTPALANTVAAAPIRPAVAGTANPGARPLSSTTLFSDTFSDGNSSAWTPVRGQWSTCRPKPSAAYLYCTRNQSDSDSFAGSASWGDYSLTASVLPLNTQGGAKGGVRYGADIAVRVQDASHYDELEIVRERDGNQHWEIWHNAGGAFTLLSQGTYSFQEGSTSYLRLVAQGPQLTASVSSDNVTFAALGTALEPTYVTGSIGLRTWGGMAANFGNVLVTSVPGAPATPIPNLHSEQGKAADAFVDSVGVNTHFDHGGAWQTLFGAYSNALLASGIRHMRDGANSHSAYLQQRGVGLLESFNVGTTALQISQNLNAVHPEAVEPMNEYDTYHNLDSNWVAHLHAEQTLLYKTVHSSGNAGITVLGPSLAGLEGSVSKFEDLSAFIDAGNEHDSTCNFNPGTDNHDNVIVLKLAVMELELKNKQPIWTTETAFHNDPAYVGCYEPESISARYLPRMFAIRWNFGQPRVYIYALADEISGSNSGQGLLHNDGSPKLQYRALTSMLSLLSDRGPAFTAPPLFYTVTGATQNVQHVLLQKRDGSYWLLLWIEASGWNRNALQFTAVPPQTVRIGLDPAIKAATAYTYDAGWNLVPAGVPLQGHWAPLTLSDSVTFLRLK